MKHLEGTHLIVDAHVQDASVLRRERMFELFDRLVDVLNMTYLVRPQAVEVQLDPSKLETDEDEGGWSYWCMITTSHIAAHTWELRKAIMLDIMSCRSFDVQEALATLEEMLQFDRVRHQVVERMDPTPCARLAAG